MTLQPFLMGAKLHLEMKKAFLDFLFTFDESAYV